MDEGCHHSSVDVSAPYILPPQVQLPSIIYAFIIYSQICAIFFHTMWEKNEKKQEEAEFGRLKKNEMDGISFTWSGVPTEGLGLVLGSKLYGAKCAPIASPVQGNSSWGWMGTRWMW